MLFGRCSRHPRFKGIAFLQLPEDALTFDVDLTDTIII